MNYLRTIGTALLFSLALNYSAEAQVVRVVPREKYRPKTFLEREVNVLKGFKKSTLFSKPLVPTDYLGLGRAYTGGLAPKRFEPNLVIGLPKIITDYLPKDNHWKRPRRLLTFQSLGYYPHSYSIWRSEDGQGVITHSQDQCYSSQRSLELLLMNDLERVNNLLDSTLAQETDLHNPLHIFRYF